MGKKYEIGILTYFKNEGNVINEWLHHYRKWGVNHIWLIDNGSLDEYNVKQFIDDGFITVWKEPTLGQCDSYNKYLEEIKKEVKWLGVFDMDEFLYSKEHPKISDAIRSIRASRKGNPTALHMIEIQMKIFLPGTFVSPTSIIESCTVLKELDSAKHPKCLYNMDHMDKVSIYS